jgi:superfamily II DNA helicase RecQ
MSSAADERSTLLVRRKKLSEVLRKLRHEKADKLNVSGFHVLQNSTLADIVVQMPTTREALVNVKGFGAKKYELFGAEILKAVQMYRDDVNALRDSPVAVVSPSADAGSSPISI